MKYALLTAAALSLSGLALAQDSRITTTDRLRQFQRDLPLIETLVREGVKLAGEANPLARAETCGILTKKLVGELKQAAAQRDQQRADTLGTFLEALLVRGVANNLHEARSRLPEDAQPHADVERIREEVLRETEPLTGPVGSGSEEQLLQPAAAAVSEGRAAVQKAARSRQ